MKIKLASAAVLAAALSSVTGSAVAATTEVSCGGPTGIRVTTIDPGLVGGLCLTGLGNPGDTELEALSFVDRVIERDEANANGGTLNIGGIGNATNGTWSFSSSVWASYSRVFLYFHFGNGGNTTTTNPDWFIVEVAPVDISGSWTLSPNTNQQGLSNIALLGYNDGTPPPNRVPEPGSLALAGLALVGLGLARRRAAAKR